VANNYFRERSKPYTPGQKEVFKLSRSKIELFTQCPRCFWLDARLKITRPNTPPFNINKTIDELFKKEFDSYRAQGLPHPMMTDNQIKAVPMQHELLDQWRYNFTGVVALHKPTNLHIFGAIDDVWVDDDGQAIVVDYKATSKNKEVDIESDWQMSYKRQMEVYQWLLRQNDLLVSDTGYFVYTNARMDVDAFGDKLEFKTKVIPYTGDDSWVEPTIIKMKQCMDGEMPAVGQAAMGGECDYCAYARSRTELTLKVMQTKQKTGNKKV
jgi:CRISPR/Cas system-associated exonuclease Cas4 (RecB family)